jgi:predicted NAD-dependent protein-ADP-ribosyltransferase YbiA (DUF1768 family)
MANTFSFDTQEILPFHGYRTPRDNGSGFERGPAEIYPSLEHFYQSEKFRGVDESYRRLIMSLPTAREARKAGNRHEGREDWNEVRERIMACGIWFKMREYRLWRRHLLARANAGELVGAYSFKDKFWVERTGDDTLSRYDRLLLSVLGRMRGKSMRVLITGSREFSNAFLFNTKLDSLLSRVVPDEVVVSCARGADSLAEQWAMSRYLPVKHFPQVGRPGRPEMTERNKLMLASATHVIAFWMGGSPRVGEIVRIAQDMRKPLRLVTLDAQGRVVKDGKRRR